MDLLNQEILAEENYILNESHYESVGDEIKVFEAAYNIQLLLLIKGPTGCAKTCFMEDMAWRLKLPFNYSIMP